MTDETDSAFVEIAASAPEVTRAAERLLVLSFIQDKEAAEAELADVRASREAWAIEAMGLDGLADKFVSWFDQLLTAAAKATGVSVSPGLNTVIPALELLATERETTQAALRFARRQVTRFEQQRDAWKAVLGVEPGDVDTTPEQALASRPAIPADRPRVVCLCGSMRFEDEIREAAREESIAGHIVVLPLCNMKEPHPLWNDEADAERIKVDLDSLHKAKIDLADEIVVVSDATGYIGDSTRSEIAYAEAHGKPVRYWPSPVSGSDTTTADCDRCHTFPHELWCPQAPKGLTMGDLRELIVKAMDLHDVHESKIVAIAQPDGRYQAVADADVRFARGQFVLALTPAEQSRVSSGGDTDTTADGGQL